MVDAIMELLRNFRTEYGRARNLPKVLFERRPIIEVPLVILELCLGDLSDIEGSVT